MGQKIHPGGFRNFLDFANGTLGDWGVHWLDQLLWWSEEPYPKFVYSAGGAMTTAPVIAGDLVLVVTEAGDLVAISRADGAEAWRVSFGTPIRTRPLVADGLVIVSTARGEIIALASPVS